MNRRFRSWIVPALAVAMSAACAGSRASSRSETSAPAAPAGPAAASPIEAARSVDAEPDVRDMAVRAIPELKTVNFAYDSDRLDEPARAVLKANAAFLKEHPAVKIQVAGHCDQRGTVAYNLALGQRRAASVRDYYKGLGVEPGRVATISYGKERPECEAATEACWSRNRRAETLEAVSQSVAGAPALH